MAFQYNDNRPITNHTHIDYPLTCGTNNAGTVTWVDFINFRNVDNFGVEPNKQSIGGTWLNVLDKLQGCFDEINDRFEQAEINYSSISIGGDTSFGANSSIFLVSNINANWTIQDISTSDNSDGARTPNMFLADTSDTYTKVNIANNPSFNKGTIEFTSYQTNDTVTLNEDGIVIKAIYNRDPDSIRQIIWQGTVKARSQANFEVYATKDVYKIFDNPYYLEGKWTWDLPNPNFKMVGGGNNEFFIQHDGDMTYDTGLLVCTNTNASNAIILKLEYKPTQHVITFVPNNGSDSWTVNGYANTTISLPDGPTKDRDDETHIYVFVGWYRQSDFSGIKYDPQFNWHVNNNDTFYAKYEIVDTPTAYIEEGSITVDKLNEDVWDEVQSIAKREATNEINAAGASRSEMTKLKSDVGFLQAYIGGLDQGFICRVGSDYTINDIYLFPNETIYIHIREATGFSGGLEIWVEGYYSERKTFDHSQLNSGDWVSVPVSELIGSHPEIQASITIHSITIGDASDATDYEGELFVK